MTIAIDVAVRSRDGPRTVVRSVSSTKGLPLLETGGSHREASFLPAGQEMGDVNGAATVEVDMIAENYESLAFGSTVMGYDLTCK